MFGDQTFPLQKTACKKKALHLPVFVGLLHPSLDPFYPFHRCAPHSIINSPTDVSRVNRKPTPFRSSVIKSYKHSVFGIHNGFFLCISPRYVSAVFIVLGNVTFCVYYFILRYFNQRKQIRSFIIFGSLLERIIFFVFALLSVIWVISLVLIILVSAVIYWFFSLLLNLLVDWFTDK